MAPSAVRPRKAESSHLMPPVSTNICKPGPKDNIEVAHEERVTIPPHPLGIKPAGNAYLAQYNLRSSTGSFGHLTDELIIQLLEYLDLPSLLRIGATCKALYAFANVEDFWKTLFVEIPRLSDLTAAEFAARWSDQPFILTDPVRDWPVYKNWSTDALLEKYGDVRFRAEAVDWPLKSYVEYMNNNADESPLYLFDRAFVEKMNLKVGKDQHGEYWAPECFGEDLFAVLGNQRPDSRWLIVGPERSGSTFHKDPNATSAWNAVLRGSKYWIMFPTNPSFPPPPGVFVSEDQSEVTSPLSIAEWLLGFHAEARQTKGCLEGICGEGEVLHVPSGWWHLVVNLSPAIAITHNFIPRAHLTAALSFLREKPVQVSGFKADVKTPYETFVERMQDTHHEMLEEAMQEMHQAKERKKRKWDELTKGEGGHESSSGGFSFGFGSEDIEVEDVL
ncbi:MAG: hypothetical protein M1827_004322 [Pycnora praestabilis]|nr:MAG: hypothetical protein M1827_004322 [Pycnora praestabilis]